MTTTNAQWTASLPLNPLCIPSSLQHHVGPACGLSDPRGGVDLEQSARWVDVGCYFCWHRLFVDVSASFQYLELTPNRAEQVVWSDSVSMFLLLSLREEQDRSLVPQIIGASAVINLRPICD